MGLPYPPPAIATRQQLRDERAEPFENVIRLDTPERGNNAVHPFWSLDRRRRALEARDEILEFHIERGKVALDFLQRTNDQVRVPHPRRSSDDEHSLRRTA
jgi:hypothetical protein